MSNVKLTAAQKQAINRMRMGHSMRINKDNNSAARIGNIELRDNDCDGLIDLELVHYAYSTEYVHVYLLTPLGKSIQL